MEEKLNKGCIEKVVTQVQILNVHLHVCVLYLHTLSACTHERDYTIQPVNSLGSTCYQSLRTTQITHSKISNF